MKTECGSTSPVPRRSFLKSTAVAAASVSALDISRFAHAAGSDTLRVGIIGVGDRGSQLMDERTSGRPRKVLRADHRRLRCIEGQPGGSDSPCQGGFGLRTEVIHAIR